MHRTLLKSELHRVTCTGSELHDEGSCAIDRKLLDAADIREYQQIDICNVNSGERFSTYAIPAERDSGVISVNGAAAHKARRGDLLTIVAYATYTEAESAKHKPSVVHVDANNDIVDPRTPIPMQRAA